MQASIYHISIFKYKIHVYIFCYRTPTYNHGYFITTTAVFAHMRIKKYKNQVTVRKRVTDMHLLSHTGRCPLQVPVSVQASVKLPFSSTCRSSQVYCTIEPILMLDTSMVVWSTWGGKLHSFSEISVIQNRHYNNVIFIQIEGTGNDWGFVYNNNICELTQNQN